MKTLNKYIYLIQIGFFFNNACSCLIQTPSFVFPKGANLISV